MDYWNTEVIVSFKSSNRELKSMLLLVCFGSLIISSVESIPVLQKGYLHG